MTSPMPMLACSGSRAVPRCASIRSTGGYTHGETDHMGDCVVDDKVHTHDLHATMLHLLGINHTMLNWNHLGRDCRLTDVQGSVVKVVLT